MKGVIGENEERMSNYVSCPIGCIVVRQPGRVELHEWEDYIVRLLILGGVRVDMLMLHVLVTCCLGEGCGCSSGIVL